jgi:hypothetical protein
MHTPELHTPEMHTPELHRVHSSRIHLSCIAYTQVAYTRVASRTLKSHTPELRARLELAAEASPPIAMAPTPVEEIEHLLAAMSPSPL